MNSVEAKMLSSIEHKFGKESNEAITFKLMIISHQPLKIKKRGDDGKYHGQPRPENNVKAYSIDHLVAYKPRIRALGEYVILDQDALDATDHSPIFTDIVLK